MPFLKLFELSTTMKCTVVLYKLIVELAQNYTVKKLLFCEYFNYNKIWFFINHAALFSYFS